MKLKAQMKLKHLNNLKREEVMFFGFGPGSMANSCFYLANGSFSYAFEKSPEAGEGPSQIEQNAKFKLTWWDSLEIEKETLLDWLYWRGKV